MLDGGVCDILTAKMMALNIDEVGEVGVLSLVRVVLSQNNTSSVYFTCDSGSAVTWHRSLDARSSSEIPYQIGQSSLLRKGPGTSEQPAICW